MSIRKAIAIANWFHDTQVDKIGLPYIFHPIIVASLLESPTEEEQIVAILHDVLEDTCCTENDLRTLFSKTVVDAVVAMTRQKDETYFTYIDRCLQNPIARKVKEADVKHNIQRSQNLPDVVDQHIKDSLAGMVKTRYKKTLDKIEALNKEK